MRSANLDCTVSPCLNEKWERRGRGRRGGDGTEGKTEERGERMVFFLMSLLTESIKL